MLKSTAGKESLTDIPSYSRVIYLPRRLLTTEMIVNRIFDYLSHISDPESAVPSQVVRFNSSMTVSEHGAKHADNLPSPIQKDIPLIPLEQRTFTERQYFNSRARHSI
jgi:hypothetical protein